MKEVSAKEAFELMEKDPNYIYLDVRSIPEFEKGHPIRALNIPLLHFNPGMGMMPNDDFVKVVEASVPKNAKVLVGCQMGGRSAQACQIMSQLGYSDVANVRGGYGGAMDYSGRISEPGWSTLQLPTCKTCDDESQYSNLAAKAKK